MSPSPVCSVRDLEFALGAAELSDLVADAFYLTSQDGTPLCDARKVWFHTPECADPGSACSQAHGPVQPQTMRELKYRAEIRMPADVAPCPAADPREHVLVAAAAALTTCSSDPKPIDAHDLNLVASVALSAGLGPQERPGLWEQAEGCSVTTFWSVLKAHPTPAVARLRRRTRRWMRDCARHLAPYARADLGSGELWWVVLPHRCVINFVLGGSASMAGTALVLSAPLAEVFSVPNDGHLLAWAVPAEFADEVDAAGAAWKVMPAGADRATDATILRALAESPTLTRDAIVPLGRALAAAAT